MIRPQPAKTKKTLDTHGAAQEINPGNQNGWYDISDGSGGNLGTLVEMAVGNVTQGSYVWYGNQAYWFWQSSAFPAGFRLTLHAYDTLPNVNPGNASPITTTGPFDTGTTYSPVTSGNWWSIQKYSGGSLSNVGWLNIQSGGAQYWYQTAPNAYLTIGTGEALVFMGSQSAPTNAMYRAVANPVG